jgi:hypothetical protein
MKRLFGFIFLLAVLSGCGFNHANMQNVNNNVTNVELSGKNFIVLDRVSGEATATYIFGIGGKSHKALLQDALARMYNNANLSGSAKALINVTFESHTTTIIIYSKTTYTASGNIIEFLK